MKNFSYLLVILTLLMSGCSKEPEEIRVARLSVEATGTYFITFGTNEQVTVKGEDNWTMTLNVCSGDTIHFLVRTAESPATSYMNVELQEGLLYCKSLYIGPQSSGSLNHIVSN